MKRPSFRLRIALLSSLLAGTVLVGFGGVSWGLIYQTKLNRIDDGIKNQLRRESDRPHPTYHWQPYSRQLSIAFNTDTMEDIALIVQDSTGKPTYQSTVWTPDLTRLTTFPDRPLTPSPRPEGPPPDDVSAASRNDDRPPTPRPFGAPPDQRRPPFRPPIEENPGAMPPVPSQLSSLVTYSTNTGSWRVGTATSSVVRMAIAVNLRTIEPEMNAIRNAYLISIPTLLILIAIGSWWLSGSALKPVRDVTNTLRQVTAKGLDQRVSVNDSDREFVELLQVFNQMMERLDRSFTQASRFSADAAHELKTPLSILQGELERTLQEADSGSNLQQRLSGLLDEVRHLSTIVRKLLLLSLADAGQMRLHTTQVNLSALLADLVDDIEMLSPDLTVQVEGIQGLTVQADQSLLIQILQNLISNATKYNLPQGWVRIEAGQRNQIVFVTVSNASKDIPISDRSRIFDRFHRGDPSRNRHVEGLGLGLSLSREIAYAHGGDLKLDSSPPRQTSLTLMLPA